MRSAACSNSRVQGSKLWNHQTNPPSPCPLPSDGRGEQSETRNSEPQTRNRRAERMIHSLSDSLSPTTGGGSGLGSVSGFQLGFSGGIYGVPLFFDSIWKKAQFTFDLFDGFRGQPNIFL